MTVSEITLTNCCSIVKRTRRSRPKRSRSGTQRGRQTLVAACVTAVLAVLSGQVGDAAGGREAAECGVSAVIVVGVEPVWQGVAAGGFGGVRLGVGPFVGPGAVEALDFAVGLGPVGAGPLVGDAELGAGCGPWQGAVAAAVVGQDALDGDAELGVPGVRAVQERGRGVLALVGE